MKIYRIPSLREIIKPLKFNDTITQYIMEMKVKSNKFF